jgi:uncharacterized DUF497 family protein
MEIEYDPLKSETNRQARGFGFDLGTGFDFESALIWIDNRFPYPETRYSALGQVAGRLHALVFTETPGGLRIISFRKANRREIRYYAQRR